MLYKIVSFFSQSKIVNVMTGSTLTDRSGSNTRQVKSRKTVQLVDRPYIEILEQPVYSRPQRFRYKCEGRSAGSIPGEHSTRENKTHPKIRIVGYRGPYVVLVSAVTKEEPYLTHPHSLVGKTCTPYGICEIEKTDGDMIVEFPNLGVHCMKRNEVESALDLREARRIDPFRQGFKHKFEPGKINLNAIRLCFQAFLKKPGDKKYSIPLQPVVSEPVHDRKGMSDLVITKLSHASGPAKGGLDMILLCEKIVKGDIEIHFNEEVGDDVVFLGKGVFLPDHVHKQVAIPFKTPAYSNSNITEKVEVQIQLHRPSDKGTSEPVRFFYTPDKSGDPIRRKKPKCNESVMRANNIGISAQNSLPRSPFNVQYSFPVLQIPDGVVDERRVNETLQIPCTSSEYPHSSTYTIPLDEVALGLPEFGKQFVSEGTNNIRCRENETFPIPYSPAENPHSSAYNIPQPLDTYSLQPPFGEQSLPQNATASEGIENYLPLLSLNTLTEANQSMSTASNLNPNPTMNYIQSEHESATVSVEQAINVNDLFRGTIVLSQDATGPPIAELSQNLTMFCEIGESVNTTGELSRIVLGEADQHNL